MQTTHPRRTRRALAAAALTVTSVLGLAAPASAQVVVVPDATGDSTATGRDLTSIRIDHRIHRVYVGVRYAEPSSRPRNYHLWVDTGGTSAPDRLVGVYLEVEPELFVHRTTRFGTEGKQLCRLRNADHHGAPGVTRFWVPRSCLGDPERLRVSLRTWNELGSEDFAPAVRTYGAWVRSSRS